MTDGERQTWAGAVTDLSSKVVTSLPSQFLALILLNTMFVLGLLWFLHAQTEARTAMVSKLLDACVATMSRQDDPR